MSRDRSNVTMSLLFFCFRLISNPQRDQMPPVKPGVYLHNPGGLYGDRSCGWFCCLSWEIPGTAVQPHHLHSQPAFRCVLRVK